MVFVLLAVLPPEAGRLMAKYCLAFDAMKQFNGVMGHETLAELVGTMGNGFLLLIIGVNAFSIHIHNSHSQFPR